MHISTANFYKTCQTAAIFARQSSHTARVHIKPTAVIPAQILSVFLMSTTIYSPIRAVILAKAGIHS
ncbi:MAG TPA: hypothetical protein VLL52_24715 [Anaerolineae bacterium]|nr:hypothetical protein [Anaerolineae bacterium]